jgi:hypothetical protein
VAVFSAYGRQRRPVTLKKPPTSFKEKLSVQLENFSIPSLSTDWKYDVAIRAFRNW